jgi:putative membrane protein
MAGGESHTANEMAGQPTGLAVDRAVKAHQSPDLGVARTLMAADRTLMAWIRTGLSMLSFGFTIYKFLLYVRESLSEDVLRPQGPRRFGLVLIGLGTACMIFGLIDYSRLFKRLGEACDRSPWSFAFILGVISTLLGLFLLITILIHREVF